MKELNTLGVRTAKMPEPGGVFGSKNIAFIYSTQNLYVELIDTDKKASKIITPIRVVSIYNPLAK